MMGGWEDTRKPISPQEEFGGETPLILHNGGRNGKMGKEGAGQVFLQSDHFSGNHSEYV
jgi:hypothetical protein